MTKLISDSMDRKITLRQRMELWMHVMMCGMCRRFRSDVRALRRQLQQEEFQQVLSEESPTEPLAEDKLSSKAKLSIAAAMKKVS
ncbi:hypothetical protein Q31a_38500 [Aureliella helgolandensis]|uniref:Zinc-finger domain-containing protein n=1 Tax=Aureliella helgolandensis TaxID=2527968 RepID=A0A518GAB2_9BACT|nr:hypothetical protein [Aureliella helgolandensis]QDV25524.1 hypothetical protein Q31a_38500 [Aureliella helgolandensis]